MYIILLYIIKSLLVYHVQLYKIHIHSYWSVPILLWRIEVLNFNLL